MGFNFRFKYAEILGDFFIQELNKNEDTSFLLKEENSLLIKLTPIINLLIDNALPKYENEIDKNMFNAASKFKKSIKIFSSLLNNDDPIIMPFGLDIDNEMHIDWLFNSLKYHIGSEYFSLIQLNTRFPFLKIVPQNSKEQDKPEAIDKKNKDKYDQFINAVKSNYDSIMMSMNEVFAYGANLNYIDNVISNYTKSYDNIFSFFIRPTSQKRQMLDPQKELLKRIKEKITEEEYNTLFLDMDVDLRNSLIHRQYYIDTESENIEYWIGKMEKNIFKMERMESISFEEISKKMLNLKITTIVLFLAFFIHMINWLDKELESTRRLIMVWKPEFQNETIFDLMAKYLGLAIIECIESNKAFENNEILVGFMLELKFLIIYQMDTFRNDKKEKVTTEEAFKEFWERLLKNPVSSNQYEIIFAYSLYLASLVKTPLLLTSTNEYLKCLKNKGIEFNEKELILELYFASLELNEEISKQIKKNFKLNNIMGNTLKIPIKLDEEDIFALLQKSVFSESINEKGKEISFIEELFRENQIYNTIIRDYVEYKRICILINDIINNQSRLPESLQVLIKVLESSPNKTLTGGILSIKIREIEKFEKWPKPDFLSVSQCLKKAARLGLVKLEKSGMDYKAVLVDYKNIKQLILAELNTEKDKSKEKK